MPAVRRRINIFSRLAAMRFSDESADANSTLRSSGLIPSAFLERVAAQGLRETGSSLPTSSEERRRDRNDLAWAISIGGIAAGLFAALVLLTWYYAATLFLIFAGILLAVALNVMANGLGQLIRLPHALRLLIVCLVLASALSGVVFLGGANIAQQAMSLSDTLKSQLVHVKAFLDRNGIDTSYFGPAKPSNAQTATPETSRLPSAGEIASSGGAIVSQTFRLLRGTVGAVGDFFIVLFLGLAFAAQPGVYRSGLIFMAPARHRRRATLIVDRIGTTLDRWLIAQMITMLAVFVVTWIGLAIIGIPGAFILGVLSGLLAFIPTVGALVAALIVVLASLASGWVAALSAFILFLGVHALESYVITPIVQRRALDIPPATLFAFQILLGVVFGIWGLALALPLMAVAKVVIDYFKSDEPVA
jgi:predicted PurR-regulated permease PerM